MSTETPQPSPETPDTPAQVEQVTGGKAEKPKRGRGRPPKPENPELPSLTQEQRDFLLALELPTLEQVEADGGLPHLCMLCAHCRIVRDVWTEWMPEDEDKGIPAGRRVLSATRYLCGEQHNALQELPVLTCEMFEPLPTEK